MSLRSHTNVRLTRLFLAAAVVTIMAVGADSAFGSDHHSSSLVARHNVSHWLTKHYAIFDHLSARQAHIADSTASYPKVTAMLAAMSQPDDPGQTSLGLNTADTVTQDVNSHPVWYVPGSNGACIISVPYGANAGNVVVATCQTIGNMSAGIQTGYTDVSSNTTTSFGLVPNGVTSVSVSPPTGPTVTAAVQNNAFTVQHEGRFAQTESFLNSAGAVISTVNGQ